MKEVESYIGFDFKKHCNQIGDINRRAVFYWVLVLSSDHLGCTAMHGGPLPVPTHTILWHTGNHVPFHPSRHPFPIYSRSNQRSKSKTIISLWVYRGIKRRHKRKKNHCGIPLLMTPYAFPNDEKHGRKEKKRKRSIMKQGFRDNIILGEQRKKKIINPWIFTIDIPVETKNWNPKVFFCENSNWVTV